YVPMPERPRLVRVDPGFTLLAEIKESKSDDLWKQQLIAAPSIVERIRAVQHFGDSKKAADRRLLATVLQEDDFYGVRMEAAKALGKSGGDFSRDALIDGLEAEHPKVRRSCAEALAKFADDDKAAETLRAALQSDDASYYVHAAVIESLSKISPEMDLATLTPLLEIDSHREVVRQAALTAIGRTRDTAALPPLIDWTKKGRHRNCRIAAMKAMANYLIRQEVPVAQQAECVEL